MLRSRPFGDRAGIALAVLCATHCVAVPVLAASLPLAAGFASESTELLFLTSSLLMSGAAIGIACAEGRCRLLTGAAFVAGAGCLIAARLDVAWAEAMERPLVLAGAGLIVAAHFINLSNCRCDGEGAKCRAAAGEPLQLPPV
jgi:hypothetical protein